MAHPELLDEDGLPLIASILDKDSDRPMHPLYLAGICQCLATVVPRNFFRDQIAAGLSKDEILAGFHDRLPILVTQPPESGTGSLSLTLLSRMRHNAFRFFYEMVSRWLVPGTKLDVQYFQACDFTMPAFSDQVYTICDLMIEVRSEEELEQIMRNLPTLETELLIGTDDPYVAQRILDVRGLSSDEKTASIHEHIAHLTKKLPHAFESDVFQEMQHLLVTCSDRFKEERTCRHFSRIVSCLYLFRRALREEVKKAPARRNLSLKLIQTRLYSKPNQQVLGICIGINFFHRHEVLEESHILKAIQRHVPEAKLVSGSFVSDNARRERIRTLYLEVEKKSGRFTSDELKRLRAYLPDLLRESVEHLMHPIFMPRNEEETMRDILALANQIKFVRDLPQVIISFDEQTQNDLVFTVIVCRVLKDQATSLQKLIQDHSDLSYHHDRVKQVGMVRRRYPKQATVFRVSLPKGNFLRTNHSLDLQAARQYVVDQLLKSLGEFRDYNGGMIAKQSEALNAVKRLVGPDVETHEFSLQNLFYSIEPPVMRNVLEPQAIQQLFVMSQKKSQPLRVKSDGEHLYAIIKSESRSQQKEVEAALAALKLPATELASTSIKVHGSSSLGLIYRSNDERDRERLQRLLEEVITARTEPVA